MHDLDQADIVFDRRGVLKTEKDRRAPALARAAHIRAAQALEDERGVLLEAAVPGLDIVHGFAKVLVISDGHMDSVDTARAHLGEDFFGPIGILQAIDPVRASHGPHSSWPAAIGKRVGTAMTSQMPSRRATRQYSNAAATAAPQIPKVLRYWLPSWGRIGSPGQASQPCPALIRARTCCLVRAGLIPVSA